MKINFHPQLRTTALTISKYGDVLTINGEDFDFSTLPDDSSIEGVPSEYIEGAVSRVDGRLHLALVRPHGTAPNHADAYPAPMENAADGIIIAFDGESHVEA